MVTLWNGTILNCFQKSEITLQLAAVRRPFSIHPPCELLHKSSERIRIKLTNYHPPNPGSRDWGLLSDDNIQWIQFHHLCLTGSLIYRRGCVCVWSEWLGILIIWGRIWWMLSSDIPMNHPWVCILVRSDWAIMCEYRWHLRTHKNTFSIQNIQKYSHLDDIWWRGYAYLVSSSNIDRWWVCKWPCISGIDIMMNSGIRLMSRLTTTGSVNWLWPPSWIQNYSSIGMR